jgi:hypothetical protein
MLVVLASMTLLLPVQHRVLLSADPLPVLDEERLTAQEFHFSVDPQQHVGALGAGDIGAARPIAPTEADQSTLAYELEPTTNIGDIEVTDFNRTVLEGPNLPENLIVKGAGSVGISGATGATARRNRQAVRSGL